MEKSTRDIELTPLCGCHFCINETFFEGKPCIRGLFNKVLWLLSRQYLIASLDNVPIGKFCSPYLYNVFYEDCSLHFR